MTDSQPARGCELKACPWCGGPAEAYSENAFPHHKRACCLKDDCPGTHVVASPEEWNTRVEPVGRGGGDLNARIAAAFPEPLIAIRVQDFVAALGGAP